MNNFTSRLITAVLAAGTVAAKHPMLSQPLHVSNLRYGTNGDQSIRLTRNEKTHRLRASDDITLTGLETGSYSGTLHFSVPKSEVTFTFSTDVSEMIVSDDTCTTCGTGTKLDSSNSTPVDGTTSTTYTLVEGKTAAGYLVTDTVCIDSAYAICASSFEFFLATSQTDLYTTQGLVGLAPYTDADQSTLLISALAAVDAITDPLFALLVTETGLTLDIGAIQEAAMEDPTQIAYITSTPEKAFWGNDITQLRTRDAEGTLSANYSFDAIEAMVSTDYECIGLPESIWNQVLGLLLAGNSDDLWDEEGSKITGESADAVAGLPTLEFLLGGQWVQVLPTDYMITQEDSTL